MRLWEWARERGIRLEQVRDHRRMVIYLALPSPVDPTSLFSLSDWEVIGTGHWSDVGLMSYKLGKRKRARGA